MYEILSSFLNAICYIGRVRKLSNTVRLGVWAVEFACRRPVATDSRAMSARCFGQIRE